MSHLLVTNDYPPKVGGIQSYLWELWRRLPGEQVTVLTTDHPAATAFDAVAPHRIERLPVKMLLPVPRVQTAIRRLAAEVGAGLVVLDPALPVGLLGPRLGLPYAVVLHGAEVTVPARLPGTRRLLRHVLGGARLVIAAGGYPAGEARRVLGRGTPDLAVVPPGIDLAAFHPLDAAGRRAWRARLGLRPSAEVVASVSRLVPRKGFDVLIEAAASLAPQRPDLEIVIAGEGRDRRRLETLAQRLRAPVRFLGRVGEEEKAGLLGAADAFAMCCRDRWMGLEQEGFGIVFLEAAAAGIPVLAGRSGGSAEAVEHGRTGLVADRPADVAVVRGALAELLEDPEHRRRLGAAGRRRVEESFSYEMLAARLQDALAGAGA